MRMLIYAGSEFMTSDAIADALLRYSEALADGRTAATIEVPVVEPDGSTTTAAFLVGPASQIVSKEIETDMVDPDAPEVLARLEALTRSLHPTATTDSEPPTEDVSWNWEN